MKTCLDTLNKAINSTNIRENRTGNNTVGYIGDYLSYDLSKGFPVTTTKRFAFKSCIAEMLAFLRGYDNASDFRDLETWVSVQDFELTDYQHHEAIKYAFST